MIYEKYHKFGLNLLSKIKKYHHFKLRVYINNINNFDYLINKF